MTNLDLHQFPWVSAQVARSVSPDSSLPRWPLSGYTARRPSLLCWWTANMWGPANIQNIHYFLCYFHYLCPQRKTKIYLLELSLRHKIKTKNKNIFLITNNGVWERNNKILSDWPRVNSAFSRFFRTVWQCKIKKN